ncbi:MAG: hypothetical protein GXO75_01670 [Calditrichaeota bacterium]|nr:hypothetical protein [Calditrichota bacterium]
MTTKSASGKCKKLIGANQMYFYIPLVPPAAKPSPFKGGLGTLRFTALKQDRILKSKPATGYNLKYWHITKTGT